MENRINVDHTVSRKEIYENKRRKQENVSVEDLANMNENLIATNEFLNKRKSKKSVRNMMELCEKREAEIRQQNERDNLDHSVSRMKNYLHKSDTKMKIKEEYDHE